MTRQSPPHRIVAPEPARPAHLDVFAWLTPLALWSLAGALLAIGSALAAGDTGSAIRTGLSWLPLTLFVLTLRVAAGEARRRRAAERERDERW